MQAYFSAECRENDIEYLQPGQNLNVNSTLYSVWYNDSTLFSSFVGEFSNLLSAESMI